MIHMAQRALMQVRRVEGSITGVDMPAMWIQRSSSAKSLENSLEAVALETSAPYLISHRRLEGYCEIG